jgi:hypothetical protein
MVCKDAIEAGFLDGDADGLLETVPWQHKWQCCYIRCKYTTPNVNYTIGAPIVITTQPINKSQCIAKYYFEVVSNAESFQWNWVPMAQPGLH